jgi:dsDNA-binding SOS-regulon protein
MFVEEKDRSFCSSNRANDHRAVTIECASDATHPYAFKKAVYEKLIELCTDICRRNGKTKLIWFGDKDKTLSYTPKSNEMILTVHRWFNPKKSCPGDWMYDRMGDLAEKVTKALTPIEEDDEMLSYDKFKEYMDKYVKENPDAIQKIFKDNMSTYRKTLQDNDSANWSADSRKWGIDTGLIQGGSSLSDGSPNYMWEDFITREQMTTFMYRFAQNLYRGFSQIFKLSK